VNEGGKERLAVGERLQKLLAAAGHGSRREIEQWIRAGRVTVDGQPATLGQRSQVAADIRLDGRRLELIGAEQAVREVLLYHKPLGEMTTRADPQGRPTVFERLPPPRTGRWVVIGRLDVNTTGLLLFTTDGELAHRLMHPSSEVQREYLVRVRGQPGASVLERLKAGVTLADGPARFDTLVPGPVGASTQESEFLVILHEGRNREVRRLWQAVGFEVSALTRLRYGSLTLPPDLRPGQWRLLSAAEANAL
jgi:23S rRNA pseudouridine2605 synthase